MKRMPRVGTYFKIPLANGMYTYGRLIAAYLFSFYSLNEEAVDESKIDEMLKNAKPIFSIYIHKRVFSQSKWEVVGYAPLEDNVKANMPFFFRQDMFDKTKCLLVNTVPGFRKPIKPDECVNLERAAVWDFEAVETRLEDFLENRPNITFERLKVKL